MKIYPLLLVAASTALLAASPLPTIQVTAGKLTLHTEAVAFTEVLATIGKQAGFSTVLMAGGKGIGNLKISDDFSGLPLDQGLDRLLHGWNYALMSDKTSGAPQKLFIVGKEGEVATGEAPVNLAAPASLLVPAGQVTKAAEAKALEDQRMLAQAGPAVAPVKPDFQSTEPAGRLAALANLDKGGVDDTAMQNLRQLAEHDPNPEVRATAIDQLMRIDPSAQGNAVLTRLAAGKAGAAHDMASQFLQHGAEEAAVMARIISAKK